MWFIVGISTSKSVFMLMLWAFKYNSDADILALLSYATVFGYFFQKLGDFFQSSGHTVDIIRTGSVAGNRNMTRTINRF